jgi:hypothetical protein
MSRAVHPTYLCPNCLKPAQKDQPLHVLLANLETPQALNFADAKTLPAPLRRLRQCEACKGSLDLPALVDGRLDYHNWGVRLGALAGAGTFAGLLSLNDPPGLPMIGVLAALAGLVAWFAVDTAERSRIARFRKSID